MERADVTKILVKHIKLLRVEQGFTQEQMATMIGISKKTLIQFEKGRIDPNWTVVVTICALFRASLVLKTVLGNDPIALITLISNQILLNEEQSEEPWKELHRQDIIQVQQHHMLPLYRVMANQEQLLFMSIDEKEAVEHLQKSQTEQYRYSSLVKQ